MCRTFAGSAVIKNRMPLPSGPCALKLQPEAARTTVSSSCRLWSLEMRPGRTPTTGQSMGRNEPFLDLHNLRYNDTTSVEMMSSCSKNGNAIVCNGTTVYASLLGISTG